MKSVWVAALCCCLFVPAAGFSIDDARLETLSKELQELDLSVGPTCECIAGTESEIFKEDDKSGTRRCYRKTCSAERPCVTSKPNTGMWGAKNQVICPDNCGSMGQTPIEECKEVPDSEECPLGMCKIGGGGGKKKCARWNPCTDASCKSAHGSDSVCVTDTMLECNSFCYEKSLVDYANRSQKRYKIND